MNSSIVDNNIRYIIKKFKWLIFLNVKKPITERTKKAYKWFVEIIKVEIIKSGVIWGWSSQLL